MISIFFALVILLLLNSYSIKVPPSPQLDFAGRLMNTYQIIAHFFVFLKFIGYETDVFGSVDNQSAFEFFTMNVCDYAGWIAIFSRLDKIPIIPKTLANTHMATGMISLLGHKSFQEIYIQNNIYLWNLFRACFVLTDSIVRSYYHFYVLNNFKIKAN